MEILEKIEYRAVEDLEPHPRNQEFHSPPSEEDYNILRQSIAQDGIQEPIWITPEDVIVSGHARWSIAKELGLEDVPVRVVVDASEDDIVYLLIASNEARRGEEKDLIKKAKKLKILHDHWKKSHRETDNTELFQQAGSKSTFYRLLKLNELTPELQELVSEGVLGLQAGNELAKLSAEEQRIIGETIRARDLQAVRLDEVKALREEIQEQKTLSPPPFPPEEQKQEKPAEKQEEERLQTVQALAPLLPETGARGVRQRLLSKRTRDFKRKVDAFLSEIQSLLSEETVAEEEIKDQLQSLQKQLVYMADLIQQTIQAKEK